MGTWTQWLRQPQRVWLRRAAFQIHLWVGLFIGLYVVVLSLTGSLLVYRNELDRYLATPHAAFDENARGLRIALEPEERVGGWIERRRRSERRRCKQMIALDADRAS